MAGRSFEEAAQVLQDQREQKRGKVCLKLGYIPEAAI